MPAKPTPSEYLLVEGKNDRHIIGNLCKRHGLQPFAILEASDEQDNAGGIAPLLQGLPVRLKAGNLRSLGVVVDADQNLQARWQGLQIRCAASGYRSLPDIPNTAGWVSVEPDLPQLGLWIMPDNRLPGMIEDFASSLIPPDDPLVSRIPPILDDLERAKLNRYPLAHRAKALLHTWLAWQEVPGQPPGLAITTRALVHDSALALIFAAWLRRLFAAQDVIAIP